jgi:hypothetical protein
VNVPIGHDEDGDDEGDNNDGNDHGTSEDHEELAEEHDEDQDDYLDSNAVGTSAKRRNRNDEIEMVLPVDLDHHQNKTILKNR